MTQDLSVSVDDKNVNVFLSPSRVSKTQRCLRHYGWENVEHLKPVQQSVPLSVGQAVHNVMLWAYEEGGTPEAFSEAVERACKAIEDDWGVIALPAAQTALLDAQHTVRTLIHGYLAHWTNTEGLWRPLGAELSFCTEVGEGTSVYLIGILDNLVTFRDRLWVVDYKTMSRLDPRDFQKYILDIQLTSYIYGGSKELTREARERGADPVMIHGAIIDALVKTKVPQYHREMFTRTLDDLRRFEKEFCMLAWGVAAKHAIIDGDRYRYDYFSEKMWQLGREDGWKTTLPMNTAQCFQYGTCAMHTLCTSDTPLRRELYEINPRQRKISEAE